MKNVFSGFEGTSYKVRVAELLLGCLRYGAPKSDDDSEDALLRRYKFENKGDDRKLRSCIDLLEDTECAIIHFCEHQLCTNRKKNELGERYLRLYGILNAVYQQISAIIEISEVVKYPGKKTVIKELSNHKIVELRNIAGSHTVNFKSGKSESFMSTTNRLNYFRLIQCNFKSDGSLIAMADGFGNYEEFNLKELVYDYCQLSSSILIKICEKYFSTIFKNNLMLKSKYHQILNELSHSPFDYRQLDKYKNDEVNEMKKIERFLSNISNESNNRKQS